MIRFISALALSLSPQERQSLIREVSRIGGPGITTRAADLDTLFPPNLDKEDSADLAASITIVAARGLDLIDENSDFAKQVQDSHHPLFSGDVPITPASSIHPPPDVATVTQSFRFMEHLLDKPDALAQAVDRGQEHAFMEQEWSTFAHLYPTLHELVERVGPVQALIVISGDTRMRRLSRFQAYLLLAQFTRSFGDLDTPPLNQAPLEGGWLGSKISSWWKKKAAPALKAAAEAAVSPNDPQIAQPGGAEDANEAPDPITPTTTGNDIDFGRPPRTYSRRGGRAISKVAQANDIKRNGSAAAVGVTLREMFDKGAEAGSSTYKRLSTKVGSVGTSPAFDESDNILKQIQGPLENFKNQVGSLEKTLADKQSELISARRDHSRMLAAASLLSADDAIADLMVQYPINFDSPEAMVDSLKGIISYTADASITEKIKNLFSGDPSQRSFLDRLGEGTAKSVNSVVSGISKIVKGASPHLSTTAKVAGGTALAAYLGSKVASPLIRSRVLGSTNAGWFSDDPSNTDGLDSDGPLSNSISTGGAGASPRVLASLISLQKGLRDEDHQALFTKTEPMALAGDVVPALHRPVDPITLMGDATSAMFAPFANVTPEQLAMSPLQGGWLSKIANKARGLIKKVKNSKIGKVIGKGLATVRNTVVNVAKKIPVVGAVVSGAETLLKKSGLGKSIEKKFNKWVDSAPDDDASPDQAIDQSVMEINGAVTDVAGSGPVSGTALRDQNLANITNELDSLMSKAVSVNPQAARAFGASRAGVGSQEEKLIRDAALAKFALAVPSPPPSMMGQGWGAAAVGIISKIATWGPMIYSFVKKIGGSKAVSSVKAYLSSPKGLTNSNSGFASTLWSWLLKAAKFFAGGSIKSMFFKGFSALTLYNTFASFFDDYEDELSEIFTDNELSEFETLLDLLEDDEASDDDYFRFAMLLAKIENLAPELFAEVVDDVKGDISTSSATKLFSQVDSSGAKVLLDSPRDLRGSAAGGAPPKHPSVVTPAVAASAAGGFALATPQSLSEHAGPVPPVNSVSPIPSEASAQGDEASLAALIPDEWRDTLLPIAKIALPVVGIGGIAALVAKITNQRSAGTQRAEIPVAFTR